MIQGKTIIAIIPARSGSKGLPGKNIIDFCGKPLLAWSIEAARKSKYVDRVVLSTDSGEILEQGKKFGAEVPFLRPQELASDTASSFDVIEHCLNFYETIGHSHDYIILLEPTSPLRNENDIDAAFEYLVQKQAPALTSVTALEVHHPAFLYSFDENGRLQPYQQSAQQQLRRQDISKLYFLDGNIYISETKLYRSKKTFYHAFTVGFTMPKWKAIEIDDYFDLVCAEAVMKNKEKFSEFPA